MRTGFWEERRGRSRSSVSGKWKQIGLVMGAGLVSVILETGVLCECHTPHYHHPFLHLQSLTCFFQHYFRLCSFLEFKHFFFPVPFFAWELNRRRAAHDSCDHAFHFVTFIFVVREKNGRKELKSHSQRAFSSVWFDTLGMPGFMPLRVMWLSSSLWHRSHFTTSTHSYNHPVRKCFLCADREGYFVYADWSTHFLLLFCLAECSPDRDTKHCLDKADLPPFERAF